MSADMEARQGRAASVATAAEERLTDSLRLRKTERSPCARRASFCF